MPSNVLTGRVSGEHPFCARFGQGRTVELSIPVGDVLDDSHDVSEGRAAPANASLRFSNT